MTWTSLVQAANEKDVKDVDTAVSLFLSFYRNLDQDLANAKVAKTMIDAAAINAKPGKSGASPSSSAPTEAPEEDARPAEAKEDAPLKFVQSLQWINGSFVF